MNAIIFFLGLVFVLTHVQGRVINYNQNDKCDAEKFKACAAAFATELGIQNLNKSVTVLANKMTQLLKDQGLDGQKQICNAGKDLKKCLGDQLSSCMTPTFLESQGVSFSDALGFSSLFNQENYICTAGWDVISKNWDCIQKVGTDNQQYFVQCFTDMEKEMVKDPTHICQYVQEMTECYSAPYNKACGSAVSDTMCQDVLLSMKWSFPQCASITCKNA